MTYCPHCGNTLLVELVGQLRFWCPTCPYIRPITKKIVKTVPTKRKLVDDIIGEESWKAAQRTGITCEKCGNKEAFFFQIQIRSADEPMTTFYKCSNFKCGFQWREG